MRSKGALSLKDKWSKHALPTKPKPAESKQSVNLAQIMKDICCDIKN